VSARPTTTRHNNIYLAAALALVGGTCVSLVASSWQHAHVPLAQHIARNARADPHVSHVPQPHRRLRGRRQSMAGMFGVALAAGASQLPRSRGAEGEAGLATMKTRRACPEPSNLGSSFQPLDDLKDQVMIVTGSNAGLGKSSVEELAKMGTGKIIMAVRNVDKGEAAKEEILSRNPSISPESIVVRRLDLADLQSVREFAEKTLSEYDRLDVLMNNAGVMASPQLETKDGFELQFGTNHLGHFLLTNLLLDRLEETGKKKGSETRIINVSSAAHFFGKMHFDDLMLRGDNAYDPWTAYGQSKLANVLFTRDLSRRLQDQGSPVTANVLHPGVVSTDLQRWILPEKDSWLKRTLTRIKEVTLTPSDKGAETQTLLAASKEYKGVTGLYFDDCKEAEGFASPESKNMEEARRLWEASEKLVGLS